MNDSCDIICIDYVFKKSFFPISSNFRFEMKAWKENDFPLAEEQNDDSKPFLAETLGTMNFFDRQRISIIISFVPFFKDLFYEIKEKG